MGEIKRESADNGSLGRRYTRALELVARELLSGNCVVFLGAGASVETQPLFTRELPRAFKPDTERIHEQIVDLFVKAESPLSPGAETAPDNDHNQWSISDTELRRTYVARLNNGTLKVYNKALPTGAELSKILAQECRLEWHRYIPLSTIAFYYEFFSSRDLLNRFLKERIDDPNIQPSTTIEHLIKIVRILEEKNQCTLVITTNYDTHFERAYEDAFGHKPDTVIYRGGWDPNDETSFLHQGIAEGYSKFWQPEGKTCLYKIHGCISEPQGQNLVITEEDYINFLSNALSGSPRKEIPNFIQGRLAMSTILFVGYSLSDWNFRVIFKATAEARPQKDKVSYADQYSNPSNEDEKDKWQALVEFWGRKFVNIVNADASDFMRDLLESVKREAGKG